MTGILGLSVLSSLAVVISHASNDNEVQATVGSYTANLSTYYNGISATSGKALLGQVHDLITSTHQKYIAYDDLGSGEYQIPLHQYYENGSAVSGYIYEFTSGAKWPSAWDPTSGSTTGGYNRGHVWPGADSNDVWSSGSGNKEKGAGSDCHHIMPQEMRLNSSMGAGKYGTATTKSDSTAKYAKLGTNATYALAGWSSGSFEPIDSRKGDTARVLMYVYTHYNSYTLTDVFGNNATTNGSGTAAWFASSAELPITNVVAGSTSSEAWATLLSWNTSDPVDAAEQRRNNQGQVYQGNRNPFIDHPEYANAIWGDGEITVTPSVSFSSSTASVTVGSKTTLSATVNNGSGTVSYSITEGSSYASVNSSTGEVTGVAAGTAVVQASVTIDSTTYTDTCTVTVNAAGSGGSSGNGDYVKISSVSDVTSGDYVLAANCSGNYYALPKAFSDSQIDSATAIKVTDDTINSADATDYALTFTVSGKSVNVYGNQYLVDTSSTSFAVSSAEPSPYSWVVSSGTNGTFRFTGSTQTSRGIIYRFGTYKRFGCYATSNASKGSTAYYDVELFKKTEATTASLVQNWVDTYLHMSDYTSNLGYCADGTNHYYSTAKTALLALGNTCISEFQNNSTFDAAQARYVAWATANGDSTPYAASSANPSSMDKSEKNSLDAILILVFVSPIVALFIVSSRKRKTIV